MKWDFDKLEKSLGESSKILDQEEEKLKTLVKNIDEVDDTQQTKETLFEILSDEEKNYHQINIAYKKYISQYSQSYIELSEYYYGPELPYNVYLKEFKKKKGDGTYLDSPEEIEELYKLFMFYGMIETFFKNDRPFP
jgi:hypothetical protein